MDANGYSLVMSCFPKEQGVDFSPQPVGERDLRFVEMSTSAPYAEILNHLSGHGMIVNSRERYTDQHRLPLFKVLGITLEGKLLMEDTRLRQPQ